MWYILAIFLMLLLILRVKLKIRITVSNEDENQFVFIHICVYNIEVKKYVYSKETVLISFAKLFEKKEKKKPDNIFFIIIRAIKNDQLKVEEFDCLLNFTTDQPDLMYILIGISSILNGIFDAITTTKKKNVNIILTVNKNESHIKCIISSRIGKIITLLWKLLRDNKNIIKQGRNEYASTSN